jgi:condensin complex subunit 2
VLLVRALVHSLLTRVLPSVAAPYAAGYDEGGGGYDDFSEGEEGPGPAARRASLAAGAGPGGASLGEDAISWLIAAGADSSSGHVTGAKGWAGASHWRYRAAPAAAGEEAEGGGAGRGRKKAGGPRRKNEPLDFVALMVEGAAPPEFELLPRGAGRRGARRPRPAAKTLLPEDQHYKAESLARYALRPRSAVALPGSGAAPRGDRTYLEDGDFADGGFADMGGGFDDGGGSDDDGGGGGGEYGGEGGGGGWGFAPGGVGDALELVEAARRVDKVEVTYARAAKQVDVRCLKELMWAGIQAVLAARGATGAGGNAQAGAQAPIEFAEVLASVPAVNAAGRVEDLSVHLCFICVLHLANEHGLAVAGVGGLDRMLVSNVPVAAA